MFLESVINERCARVNLEKDKAQISQSYIKNFKKNFGDLHFNDVYK